MRLFNSILLTLALAGCRTLPVTEIPIARGATFDLQSPAALGQAISLEQIVEAKYGDKEFSFHCLLEVDAKQLTLVGMTPMNTRAFTLTFDGKTLSVETMPGAELPAPPEHILADLQLALWPIRRVNSTVQGLVLSEHLEPAVGGPPVVERHLDGDDGSVILIRYDKESYSDTAPWSGTLVFENIQQGYTLVVKTLRAEKLEP